MVSPSVGGPESIRRVDANLYSHVEESRMIITPDIPTEDSLTFAQALSIHVCGDDQIHMMMEDAEGNPLADIIFDPEEALAIAKKIEQAADIALGIA